MEVIIEQVLSYGLSVILIISILAIYLSQQKRQSKVVSDKILQAKADGLHEPVSLYPVVDINRCIQSGACIEACPEKEILGITNGKASIINASRCIGHGACFRACPVEAISLWIGTEKRGVDLPHVSANFETNVRGIFIAGELGGMGLIRNAITQGREAVEQIVKIINKETKADYDLIVVGAGPAGISGTLAAKKAGLNVLTLEQDTLGGAVYTYPRSKIVMTAPMDLPLYGKVKFRETSKTELLSLWKTVIEKNKIEIVENSKVEAIIPNNGIFSVETINGEKYSCKNVLLSIGRRGTPRKLGVLGENTEKVAYRLLEPEIITDKDIVVVGGGDSAIEAALSLADKNRVTLSYRSDKFSRIKQKNAEKINEAIKLAKIVVKFNSNVVLIEPEIISYTENNSEEIFKIKNDLIYIFAGGELPTEFLKKMGIEMSTKHGEVVLKH
ncbi:MAG: NAD(P)-binding domain-containing protein [Paludibacter sp.]|nr:NAD(P)-binding domain-containing protein [Paludibacter sp.]